MGMMLWQRRELLLRITLVITLALSANLAYAQHPNVRVSNDAQINPDPEEVSIAVNPRNTSQLAIGANIDYLYTSSDSGWSWAMQRMQSQYNVWGDPVVLFDDSGILYYEHLSGHDWSDPQFLWRIVVQRSLDAGQTFDVDAEIGLAPPTWQDKAWLGLDRSPTVSNGTILTSWNEDDKYGSHDPNDSDRIFFSKSSDHGQTWTERVRVDDRGGDCVDSSNTVEGATTAVGPSGDIYIAWCGRDSIFFDKSRDGGKTFGKDQVIMDQPGGWDFKVPGVLRTNGFPMLLSDLNMASPYYGRLYLMWSDQRRGVTDVYVVHSDLFGAPSSWSKPLRVNTDSALNHHFFPSMTLDPVTGHLFVVFYDRRAYTTNETDVYLASSSDGGASFSNTKLSESAFLPADTVFFGDYIHVTAFNRHVFPVWMRVDPVGEPLQNHTSVWTAIVSDTMDLLQPTNTIPNIKSLPDLLTVSGGVRPGLVFSLSRHEHVTLQLLDLLGRQVALLINGDYGAGEYHIGIPESIINGSYLVRMVTIGQGDPEPENERTAKLVIAR